MKTISVASLLSLALAGPALAQDRPVDKFSAQATQQEQHDPLETLVGRWSRDADGEFVKIEAAFVGWELWHSRLGQFSISPGDGNAGANIKVSGRGPTENTSIDCYYYVSVNSDTKMTWALRQGPADACGQGKTIYTYVPSQRSHADEIADAVAYRNRLNKTVASGPSDMLGVDVVYFERTADSTKIRDALDLSHIGFTTRSSESPMASNVVTCTKDVPIDATKILVRELIKARVPVRVLRPSTFQQYPRRLTIESLGQWVPNRPLITLAQVDALTSCNVNNLDGPNLIEPVSARPGDVVEARPKVFVSLPNNGSGGFGGGAFPRPTLTRMNSINQFEPIQAQAAPRVQAADYAMPSPSVVTLMPPTPISFASKEPISLTLQNCPATYNVTAKFWSPATQSWRMSHLKSLTEGSFVFKNSDDTAVMTSTREVYFAVRNVNENRFLKLSGDPIRFPGGDTDLYKRGTNLLVSCGS